MNESKLTVKQSPNVDAPSTAEQLRSLSTLFRRGLGHNYRGCDDAQTEAVYKTIRQAKHLFRDSKSK